MSEMRLAAHVGAWKSEEYVGALAEAREAGFAGVEVPEEIVGLYEDRPTVFREMLAEEGLRLAAVEAGGRSIAEDSLGEEIERLLSVGRFLAAVGEETLILRAPTSPEGASAAAGARAFADLLAQAASALGKLGARICVRPVFGSLAGTKGEIERLLRRARSPRVTLALDAGHLARVGLSPARVLMRRPTRVGCIHIEEVPPAPAPPEGAGARGKARGRKPAAGRRPRARKAPRGGTRGGGGPVEALLREVAASAYEGWIVVDRRTAEGRSGLPADPEARRELLRRDRERLARHLEEG